MEKLKTYAGKAGSCIIEAGRGYVKWRNASGGTMQLDIWKPCESAYSEEPQWMPRPPAKRTLGLLDDKRFVFHLNY